jgi:hypothetical protein
MVCMRLPVELAEYLSYSSSYDGRLRATSENQQSQTVTSPASMSLVHRDQQIATPLRTTDEDDKRLLFVAACIYTSSCTWLASEMRSLAGFTHPVDNVADPRRIFEIVPWLLDISASSLDTLLKRLVAIEAHKVIIEKLLHVTRHSTSSIALDRMRKLDFMISQSPTRYNHQPRHIQPIPRASLLEFPLELFNMVIHSENLAATAEFKSALGLLTMLPRCTTILLQHETLSSWRLCDFESNRRIVRDRTVAVLDVVMRKNLEVCCMPCI